MSKEEQDPQASFSCFLTDQREELTEKLRSRLIECGWRDQVANMCRNMIQQHGVEQVRLEQMINEVGPKARQSVPEQVKTELLEAIRKEMKANQPTGAAAAAVATAAIVETDEQHRQQPLQKQTIMESNGDSSFVL